MWDARTKRLLARLLCAGAPLTILFKVMVRLRAPRHRIGVLALVHRDGLVLIGHHTFRPWSPRGLLGGWIEPGEEPADALRRELREELGSGAEVAVGRLLTAGQHGQPGEPAGLSLVYECRLSGQVPGDSDLPLELISLEWLRLAEARVLLRPIELQALETVLFEGAGVSCDGSADPDGIAIGSEPG